MSDFLASVGKKHSGEYLLNLIKKPYGARAPEGRYFDLPWGSIAVLKEQLASRNNIVTTNGTILAWVGDLVMDLTDTFLELFVNRLTRLLQLGGNDKTSLEADELFEGVNGTFAMVFGNDKGFSIVTDLLSFIPVYLGKNKQGRISSFGTNPDLVAVLSGQESSVDIVSVGEFLDTGHTLFPHTMYQNVEQLKPGTVHYGASLNDKDFEVRSCTYWSPPKELREMVDERELAEELRKSIIAAVTERCCGKVAVSLSGGLDSRLILAAVPQEVECIAVTFGDMLNREMKTARRVAGAYNREWFPLFRHKEFLGRGAVDIIRLMGCENGWVNHQILGYLEDVEEFGVESLLDGNGIDEYIKGFWAGYHGEIEPVKRLGGLLPAKYVNIKFDYENTLSTFSKSYVKESVIEAMRARRKEFSNNNLDPTRTSVGEQLTIYPHSHDFLSVSVQRLLPQRTCGADRRLLDLGFKCPVEFKFSKRLLFMAGREIYAKGRHIPTANDGVRPCSGHWSRLAQRGVRKLRDGTTKILEKLGKEPRIEHSWHDYQRYWIESKRLALLAEQYGAKLDEFDGMLFKERGHDLLGRKDQDWRSGFRLLQLAIWRGIIDEYRS